MNPKRKQYSLFGLLTPDDGTDIVPKRR